MKTALDRHAATKRTRDRGKDVPTQLAALTYLRGLEGEMAEIRAWLDTAWKVIDSRDFRKCSRHMDHAQQRIHKVIRQLASNTK